MMIPPTIEILATPTKALSPKYYSDPTINLPRKPKITIQTYIPARNSLEHLKDTLLPQSQNGYYTIKVPESAPEIEWRIVISVNGLSREYS